MKDIEEGYDRDQPASEEWRRRVAGLPRAADVVPDQWADISAAIRPASPRSPWWIRIAAAVTLFGGGLAGGFAAGARQAPEPRASIDEAMALAAEVQRTGSEYVAALAAFTAVVDSLSNDVRLQGRDAAIATMVGAATELATLTGARQAMNSMPTSGRSDGTIRF